MSWLLAAAGAGVCGASAAAAAAAFLGGILRGGGDLRLLTCEQWTGEDGTGGAKTEAEGAKKKRRGAQTTRNKE